MEPTTLLAFTVALTIAAFLPGPGMTAVVARALAVGFRGTLPLVLGMILGDLTFLACAALGLAALANTFETVFTVVKWAGAAYLVFLAFQLWTAKPQADEVSAENGAQRSFLRVTIGGLVLTLGNPKTIVFYMALLPSVIDLATLTPVGLLGALGDRLRRSGDRRGGLCRARRQGARLLPRRRRTAYSRPHGGHDDGRRGGRGGDALREKRFADERGPGGHLSAGINPLNPQAHFAPSQGV